MKHMLLSRFTGLVASEGKQNTHRQCEVLMDLVLIARVERHDHLTGRLSTPPGEASTCRMHIKDVPVQFLPFEHLKLCLIPLVVSEQVRKKRTYPTSFVLQKK